MIHLEKIPFNLVNKSISYLVIILVSAENVVSHEFVDSEGSRILNLLLKQQLILTLSQNFGSYYCLK